MFTQIRSRRSTLAILAVLLAGVLAAALVLVQPARAHCDSEQGPVAAAALKALETGDVSLVLPYVKPDAEKELTAVFKQSLQVRRTGGEAKELADRYFIETAVRLHRQGEGAPYTGLTDEAIPEPILAADQAMATGSLNKVDSLLTQALENGLHEKYEAVVKAREEAKRLGTVEANRERVEAELAFEKYVYDLYHLASGGQPAEGHSD